MINVRMRCIACFIFCMVVAVGASAKDQSQQSWGLVKQDLLEVYPKRSKGKKVLARINSGELVAVFETKRSGGTEWDRVRVAIPTTLEEVTGWTEASQIQSLPTDQFPTDAELMKSLGGVYLEDFHARYVKFARFLVHRGPGNPNLVCYFGSTFLPQTRLQLFTESNGKWLAGPFLEFHFSQMQSGMTEIKIRDLVGDGKDCLITREPFSESLGVAGVDMVIRRIEGNEFKVLWRAPVELKNLSAYSPSQAVLDPPEKNIGAPGTVTTATVDFQKAGSGSEPVWKGKIKFYVVGREEPIDSISVEKHCPWNGKEFAPVRPTEKQTRQN
jgi:hypothetical protein